MKTFITSMIALFILLPPWMLYSQVYFPAEGNWDQKYHSIAWGHGGVVLWDITTYTTFHVNGTITVNDTLFYTVLKNDAFSFYTCEIGQKVFLGNTTGNLKLIYDYSLQVGDTFHFNAPDYSYSQNDMVRTVTACDSIFVGDTWRKRITFSDFPGYGKGPEWIQGIGDVNFGGLETDYSYVSWCNNTKTLECFSNYGIQLYGVCTTGIPEPKPWFLLYPNPCKDEICIELPPNLLPADLRLYNTEGLLVKQLELARDKEILRLGSCRPGIYFLQIKSKGQVIRQKLMVVSDQEPFYLK